MQIVEWYDELVRLTDSPVARVNRAVAVGEADGPRAGPAARAALDPALPRHTAATAYMHERESGRPLADRGQLTQVPHDRRRRLLRGRRAGGRARGGAVHLAGPRHHGRPGRTRRAFGERRVSHLASSPP